MMLKAFELPTQWACALINGDESGMEDEESKALNAFVDSLLSRYKTAHCVSVKTQDAGDFRRYHDATRFYNYACESEYGTASPRL